MQFLVISAIIHIIKQKPIKDLGLLLIIHLMRADIKAEVSPIVGSEKQSEDIVKFLLREFEEDPAQIWQSNLFGKTLHELINESLNAKLSHMPNEARKKLCHTLTKIINDGAGGLICILL